MAGKFPVHYPPAWRGPPDLQRPVALDEDVRGPRRELQDDVRFPVVVVVERPSLGPIPAEVDDVEVGVVFSP